MSHEIENRLTILKLLVASLIFIFRYCEKVTALLAIGAIFLKASLEVIHEHALFIILCHMITWVVASQADIFQVANTLEEFFQRAANSLSHPVINFSKGCRYTQRHSNKSTVAHNL